LILSTVGHSEWCPPGSVRVDLDTGRYLLAPRAPRATCNEPSRRPAVRRGALAGATLERVRAASLRLQADGMLNPDCRAGGKPRTLVITNGGTPRLTLSTDQGVVWAPDDLSCWSEAGRNLHEALEEIFGR